MPTPLDPSPSPSWWREYPGTVAVLLGFVILFVAVLMWGLQVRGERRAEWQAFAQANACVHVASRSGDINVTVQVVPTGTNSAAVVPMVDTHPDVHAWRCADGRIILNKWKPWSAGVRPSTLDVRSVRRTLRPVPPANRKLSRLAGRLRAVVLIEHHPCAKPWWRAWP